MVYEDSTAMYNAYNGIDYMMYDFANYIVMLTMDDDQAMAVDIVLQVKMLMLSVFDQIIDDAMMVVNELFLAI